MDDCVVCCIVPSSLQVARCKQGIGHRSLQEESMLSSPELANPRI